MAVSRLLFLFIISITISICMGNFIEDFLEFIFMSPSERSLPHVIMDYLDHLYPKDDMESSMMKHVFMLWTDEEDAGSSEHFGLEFGERSH